MSALAIAVVAIGVLWACSQYWLAPIVIKTGHPLTPHITDLHPVAASDVHPGFGGVLDQYRASLQALGFVPAPILTNRAQSSPSYVQLYEHPRHGDVATVIVLPDPEQPLPANLVGFTTLVGGVRLRTLNSAIPSTFPTPPGNETARFPWERDPARLYALHRARVKRSGRRPEAIRVGDPVAYQRQEEAAGPKNWVSSGYAVWDGAELRATWKGAFCMPYRLLFPWKHVNEWRNEALRQRLLPEAGLA